MASARKPALGRGLNALLADAKELKQLKGHIDFNEVEIDLIDVNPYQPRTNFEPEALEELASSIKKLGIIQPITLRREANGRYQIISGERRFRASKIVGLTKVPAYLRKAGDEELLEMALVENIQRENLNPIEVAVSYQRLIEEFTLTQEQVSLRVGKSRSAVTNIIRLLKLPASVQHLLQTDIIQTGHARALLGLADDNAKEMLAEQIVKHDYSVRKVEELVKQLNSGEKESTVEADTTNRSLKEFNDLKSVLSDVFKTKVNIACKAKGDGRITINFKSDEELERILGIFDNLKS